MSVGRERVRQKGGGLTHSSPSQPDMDQPQAKPQADFIFQQKLQEALSGWHIVLMSVSGANKPRTLGSTARRALEMGLEPGESRPYGSGRGAATSRGAEGPGK